MKKMWRSSPGDDENLNNHSSLALLGTVLDTRDTYVKIHLRIDETQDADTAKWFAYASEANNLFYCMPEIGQNLSLYFSNADENSAIAINSVRRNGCNCADMTDPALKRMTASPSGHTFGLGQGDIDFTKHEGLFITLSDGVTVKSDTDIAIVGQNVTLIAEESVIIAAEENLIVSSGAEAQIYLSEETGDANLIAPGMVKFDAEGGSPLEPFSRTIAVDAVPEPEPEPEPEPRSFWRRALRAVAIVAVAVIVTAVVVKTGGAALAAIAKVGKVKKATAAVKKATSGLKKYKAVNKVTSSLKKKKGSSIRRGAIVNASSEGIQADIRNESAGGIFVAMLGGGISGAVSSIFGAAEGAGRLTRFLVKTGTNIAGTITNRLVTTTVGNESWDGILGDFLWDAGFGLAFGGADVGDLLNIGGADTLVRNIFEAGTKYGIKTGAKGIFGW